MKKYVTFNAEADLIGVFKDILEHNKDYVVKGILSDTETNSVIEYYILRDVCTMGVSASFFYPQPTREELLPSKVEVEEEESSFDNLVRSDYVIQEGDYFVLNKLSEEQKEFLSKELPVYDKGFHNVTFNHCFYDDEKEFVARPEYWCEGKELSFNLLFVEKEESCEDDSFEDLVYVEPNYSGEYCVINLSKLTDVQFNYCINNLHFDDTSDINKGYKIEESDTHLNYNPDNSVWFFAWKDDKDVEITFNDIFIKKDSL